MLKRRVNPAPADDEGWRTMSRVVSIKPSLNHMSGELLIGVTPFRLTILHCSQATSVNEKVPSEGLINKVW